MRNGRFLSIVWFVFVAHLNCWAGQMVTTAVETFDWILWSTGWSKAAGCITLGNDRPAEIPAGRSVVIEIHFSGRGFEWFSVKPPRPIWIPGEAKSVTVRYKASSPGYTIVMEFLDGWERSEVDGKRFTLALPVKEAGRWQTATFKIPEDWLRPVAITGINIHNWDRQNEAEILKVWIDQIDAQTDLSSTDLQTGLPFSWRPKGEREGSHPVAVFETELTSVAENHVFAGEEPIVVFRARNWLPQPKRGKLALWVTDFAGNEVSRIERVVNISGLAEETFPLPLKRFGWYQVRATLELQGGIIRSEQLAIAFIPPSRNLTESEKLLSPYGLNVHGGRERLTVETFCKAGVVWFRDYAFSFETMLKAKGDGRFDSWPWYHRLLWYYQRTGAKVLACLQGAIKRPEFQQGKVTRVGPDLKWRREMASIIASFPSITHWELDNEYDLSKENRDAEEKISWANYRAFHRAFAEILTAISGGTSVAVEQGRAGIDPERIYACVGSGDLERIGVVNVHHYCGSDPPELNIVKIPDQKSFKGGALFFDLLREAKKAAESDGKERQLWLTEFGWDTLAGHKVSPFEQAVYLQRGWLLALAAGADKAFWFYDFDSPEPRQFFDGCGLLTANGQPKLSFCALAALTHLLPTPRYTGDCNAGAGTQGFVFETDGKLVAVMWSVESDFGPVVKVDSGQPHDFLANPLSRENLRLTRAPLFLVGISHASIWFKQTAYSIETPYFFTAAAGDAFPIHVKVRNNRNSMINAVIRILVPEKWQVDRRQVEVQLPPNTHGLVTFNVTVSPEEPVGSREVTVMVEENGQRIKEMRVKVLVGKPATISALPMDGDRERQNWKSS